MTISIVWVFCFSWAWGILFLFGFGLLSEALQLLYPDMAWMRQRQTMNMAGSWVLQTKSEVLDTIIQHNTFPILRYLCLIALRYTSPLLICLFNKILLSFKKKKKKGCKC